MVLAAILPAVVASACGAKPSDMAATESQDQDAVKQWKLPKKLREISGLALTPDERLLAVSDEQAIVYELDYQDGRIIKSFAFGDPAVRADFEGIAVLRDTVWLMTSDGLLYAAVEGPDGRNVRYRKYDTGHGDYCELEGLAQDRVAGTLILACKEAKSKQNDLMIFEWSASNSGIEHVRDVIVPERSIAGMIDKKRINPSGIAVDPQTGERVLIAARQRALVRLTTDGVLSEAVIRLKKGRHKQAEGIEMTRDGRLLIADEGSGGRARLTVYPARNRKQQ
ncbi:MAG: hypothetical protein E2O53_03780 [Gammaproteobacteria bacterium]|nr:MAG: hypothetical protein E2O53_03780 [Gammaproteobacteria bacterium]